MGVHCIVGGCVVVLKVVVVCRKAVALNRIDWNALAVPILRVVPRVVRLLVVVYIGVGEMVDRGQ